MLETSHLPTIFRPTFRNSNPNPPEKMKTYEIEIHRADSVLTRVSADTLADAKQQAADINGVDANDAKSFGYWRIVPTAKQIRRTQSLLRSL